MGLDSIRDEIAEVDRGILELMRRRLELARMVGEEKEGFWFPLAAGTIGGLVLSLVGIFFYLPIFSLKRQHVVKR